MQYGKHATGMAYKPPPCVQEIILFSANNDNIKRFFVGPEGCEVTGITMAPDFKTLFINIQHPGNTWGAIAGGSTPRSATVMITREDGDVILAESFV